MVAVLHEAYITIPVETVFKKDGLIEIAKTMAEIIIL
jgi:hypothetical protein